jgi:transcriptional regulator with XRE-family HTH domain
MKKREPSVGTLGEVVGRNVRTVREEVGFSQTELGGAIEDYLGRPWPKQVVSQLEKGRRLLDTDELVAVARTLKIPVVQLLTAHRDEGTDENEVELPAWTLTIAELREAVMGATPKAAIMNDVCRETVRRLTRAIEAEARAIIKGGEATLSTTQTRRKRR